MTEPDLIKVLSSHLSTARKPNSVLKAVGQPDFPKLFFKTIGVEKAYDVLLSIYHGLTVKQQELCEAEKAIVKEIRTWDKATISEQLKHLRGCFLDSDLR